MDVTRRDLFAYGTAGAISVLAAGKPARPEGIAGTEGAAGEDQQVPGQVASDRAPHESEAPSSFGSYDMRRDLKPGRLTLAVWGVDYALRHMRDGSFADYDRVLDQAVERGYNTLRIDPMPQWIDLKKPQRVLEWPDPKQPFMPWNWNTAVKGPVAQWVIDFIEKLHRRPSLYYTLSGWWFMPGVATAPPSPAPLRHPANMIEGAEMWVQMLTDWKKQFGFDRLVYVDIANETPYFFPGLSQRIKKATGADFDDLPSFSESQISFLAAEINQALNLVRREFPELRFTTSIHGDLRWLDVPLELDCLDVHFYADADPRWTKRTRFDEFSADHLFETDRWFKEFSERSTKTARAMAPMLRARQRSKMSEFASWAERRGAPLTTTEGWASWYYIDHPDLDWGWLLDWSRWSCDDAIACKFWGWTPHNCPTPQFANWNNAQWHRELNERFLKG